MHGTNHERDGTGTRSRAAASDRERPNDRADGRDRPDERDEAVRSRHPVRALQQRHGNAALQRAAETGDGRPGPAVARPDDAAEALDGETERRVRSATGGGRPLPSSVRSFFEPRFGTTFDGVRVHTGPDADEAARAVDAQAFALGRDVVFRSGAYRPGSEAGRRLLAHELTHVVQSRAGDAAVRTQQAEGSETDSTDAGDAGGTTRIPTLAEVAKAKTIGLDLLYDLNVIQRGYGDYVGSRYTGDVPEEADPEEISCIGLVLEVLERTFEARGEASTWNRIRSRAYDESGAAGLKGTVLMEQLQAAGWKGIYWNPDTDRGGEHAFSHRVVQGEASSRYAESGTYYDVPIEESVTDYTTDDSETPTNPSLSKLEQLRFGVVAAQGGTHTAVLVNGGIYEVHWARSCTDMDLIEYSGFRDWSARWGSGAVVVPPGEMERVWGGGSGDGNGSGGEGGDADAE